MASQPDRLLIIDIDAENRAALSRRLVRSGYAVDVAGGGIEAIEKIQQAQYDLVLLDQMTPGMSGLDLLSLLRATRGELPVMMVTGADRNQAAVNARIEAQLSYAKAERDGLWSWDLHPAARNFSAHWEALLGYAQGEIETPEQWLSRIHPDDRARVQEEIRAHLGGETPELASEHRICAQNGEYRWVLCRGAATRSAAEGAVRIAGSLAGISSARLPDPLTGTGNRLTMLDRIAARIADQKEGGRPFAVLLLDLDGFKTINDGFGRHAGDRALLETAACLRAAAGPVPISRMGGDEFAILVESFAPARDATALAAKILANLASDAGAWL